MKRLLTLCLLLSPATLADVCSAATTTVATVTVQAALHAPHYVVTVSVSGTPLIANVYDLPLPTTAFQILDSPDGVAWCPMYTGSLILPSAVAPFTTSTKLLLAPALRRVSSTPPGFVEPYACGLNVTITYASSTSST